MSARELINAAIEALPKYPSSAVVALSKALTAQDAEQEEKKKYKRALLSIKKRSHIKERCEGDCECDCAWGIACRTIAPKQWKELLEQEQRAIKQATEGKGGGEG